MQIHIRNLAGKTTTLEVDTADTVDSVRKKLTDAEGIAPDQCRLVFGGKQMTDGRTLEDYHVEEDCTLHAVMRLQGGIK